MNHSQLKDKYFPVFLKAIPEIIEEHLDEMKTNDEFKLFIQNTPEYSRDLSNTIHNHCHAIFFPNDEYQYFLNKSEQEAFDVGIAYAETNYFTIELILKVTHSTRMCIIRKVLDVLNDSKIVPSTSTIIERLFELTNIRQNSLYEGYIHKQNEKLRMQNTTDPLTGLYNRRYFYDCIIKEMTKAFRTNYPISLMLIDLNNLKQINDEFGHREGDRLLEHFAQAVSKIRSDFDSVFRFGGDEFVIIVPNCNEANAKEIGVRLNEEVSIFHSKGSISYGVVNLPLVKQPEKLNIEHYLKISDDRMYQYKANYKDKVTN